MAGESVGNAYLNVVPKIDGDAKSLGSGFGSKFSSGAKSAFSAGAVALGNILSSAITSAAGAVGGQFANAFWNYADYEQLIGGVDTLFKEASSTVQENAKQAFKTAGMSANEYMENVTSFSASLIQSLDGDTTKAAEVANRAMVDMSDNANKMGSDINEITRAYQSFARGQYGLLDNLKLGYGGTKSEMERLLADASKIAGVQFNIDSYADVIEAIHVMQESMDIAGTTMTEGSTTISGSINQLKGAWDNFLTALGDGGQTMDMDAVINDLFDSIGAVAENVLPALGRVAESIASNLPTIFSKAFSGLGGIVSSAIGNAFGSNAQAAFDGALQQLSSTAEGAMGKLGATFEGVQPAIENLVAIVQEQLPEVEEVFMSAFDAVSEIVETVWPDIESAITSAVEIIGQVIETVIPPAAAIAKTAFEAIRGVVQVVWPVISAAVETAVNTIKSVINGLKPIVSAVRNTFNSVRDAIKTPIEKAKQIVSGAVDRIKGLFPLSIGKIFSNLQLPHISVSGGSPPFGIGGKGSLPSFSVNWYARGGFANGAQLIGVGEQGTELIWPEYSPYFDKYANAIAERINGGNITINLNYDAGADANEMLMDISSGIRQLRAAGAI